MLKTLRLQNFQAHADTTIEFSPYVTCIVGLNNNGKSSILRALHKVVRDEPEGKVFIRDGETECTISVDTDRGNVTRIVRNDKSSNDNTYVINGVEYTKFGHTGIPPEVGTVLGVSPVQAFGDLDMDMNFHTQMEPEFLMIGNGLPSIRGKVLGKVTGVDTCQRAIQIAASEEKSFTKDAKRISEDLHAVISELGAFDYLQILEESMGELSVDTSHLREVSDRLSSLEDIYSQVKGVVSRAKSVNEDIANLSVDVGDNVEHLERIYSIIDTAERVVAVSDKIDSKEKWVEVDIPATDELEELLERIESLEAVELGLGMIDDDMPILEQRVGADIPDTAELEQILDRVKQLHNLQVEVDMFLTKSRTVENSIVSAQTQLEESEVELHKLEDELGVCPVCERPFESTK